MEPSIHTEINRLDTGLKQLAFAIGQGVDRETLHGNIIELLLSCSTLKRLAEPSHAPLAASPAPPRPEKNESEEVNKVRRKTPKWASNPQQINARLLNLFIFMCDETHTNSVHETDLKDRYGNDAEFDRNFPQMKSIAEKNHGKVFEVDSSGATRIWQPVKLIIDEYKYMVAKMNMASNLNYVRKAYEAIFGHEGRPFGLKSKPYQQGLSEHTEGVQWNFFINAEERTTLLGINLEGMKYDDWPIAHFLEHEMENPSDGLLSVASTFEEPDDIEVRLLRDAWQVSTRRDIDEAIIGGEFHTLDQLTPNLWKEIVQEAYSCLDPSKNHRARAEQKVTLTSNGEQKLFGVSPHLTIVTPLWKMIPPSTDEAIRITRDKMDYLKGIRDFVETATHYNT